MILTVYQVKLALAVFLSLYTLLGLISLAVWQIVRSGIFNAVEENGLDVKTVTLINTIDVSLHGTWLLYHYFLILGILLLTYAIWGAVGVLLENAILLKVYGILLLIISSMKVPIVAYSLYESGVDALAYAKSDIWSNFEKSRIDSTAAKARDFLQDYYSCCGVNGYKDYADILKKPIVYPKSCCHDKSTECSSTYSVIKVGCAEKIASSYVKSYQAIGTLSLLIIILEILATVLSFYLPRLIKERKKRLGTNAGPSSQNFSRF